MSFGRHGKRDVEQIDAAIALLRELTQIVVIDYSGELGVTPFADALHGYLKSGHFGTGRKIFVAEDVGHGGIVKRGKVEGLAFCRLDSLKVAGAGYGL